MTGLLVAFLVWLEDALAASGIPPEMREEEKMAIRHLPGSETEARIVWTGDGPWLAATFLRSAPVRTGG